MCDEGRLSFQRLYAAPRLLAAQAPQGTEIEWDQAMSRAAQALKEAAKAGTAAAVFSSRLTSETLFAWKELFDELGGVQCGVSQIERGEDDDLLLRADKGANARGASWLLGSASAQGVFDFAAEGRVETLIVVGDPLDPEETPRLPENVVLKVKNVIYAGAFIDATAEIASLLIPTAAWAEEDGTMVNFEGRIQRVRRCHMPRGEGRPGWRMVADLREAAGLEPRQWNSSAEVLESLAAAVGAYAGLDEERIGLLGVAGAAETAGGA
jgi:predicted molibdopterin-dependent oxidoreductase YjgC